ncbi:MAG: MFS transporter [Pirellulales bacterium]
MHDLPEFSGADNGGTDNVPWWKLLNSYHWFVLIVAALGWLFDTMDQQLFLLARVDAMRELLGSQVVPPGRELKGLITEYSGYATSIFMLGWAAGGLLFGVLGDRIGRAKTMMITILMYSIFTGLSAFSIGFWDFAVYRFLTGLGVGGEFAVGVSLVAEVMPVKARPYALGLLQALSAVGNMTAALISMSLGHLEESGGLQGLELFGTQLNAWRLMFIVGILPALLVIVIRRRLKEPEQWKSSVQSGKTQQKAGSYAALFSDPRWRKNAIVGVILASSGVVGLWGIGFFFPDLIDSVFRKSLADKGMTDVELNGTITRWKGIASLMTNLGAFFGIYGFAILTQRIGRRPAFLIAFLAAMGSTLLVFGRLSTPTDVFWMLPLMGFCQLALFGGYAIYFPELFPTYLRSTGISFCYNVGRIVAAFGPSLLGQLSSNVFSDYAEPMRPAAMVMCSVFVIGILALPFAPETKDKPLPE